ncbi:unnamed protein product [Schistosoma rodhaini]|uniref:Protein-tyrosine-phosphatase n=1 Tax=Schistosoma rodhaini TaxID=6188 RepID=A0AA85GAN8_9TREM|nr:unnamed protein product [Schistosoma rodhaini]
MSISWHIYLILLVSNLYCESSFNVAVSASNPVGSTFNQGFTYGVTDAAPDVSTNSTITASATTNFTTTTDGFNQSKSSFNVAVSASNPVGSTFNQGFTYGVTDAAPDVSTNSTITASATTNFTTTTDGFNQSKSSFNVAVSASNPVGSTFNQGFTYGVTDAAPDVSTNSTITASATTNFTTTTDEFNQSIQLLNTSIHTPKLIQISNITSTSFVIIWPVVKTNGSQFRVSTYEISLNSQRQSLLLIKNISSEVFREKIENLTACTIYTIQMRLVIKQYETVCSEWSKPLTVFTSISTPNPPVNVTFIETRSTQLRVVWMPPEENSAFNINCFLVYIRPTFTVFGHFQKFNICHSNVCDIKSLCPGVNYTVYVESFDSTYGIRSLPSNYITAVTYPDSIQPPVNLTISEINIYGFTVHWDNALEDHLLDNNNNYYYVFIKPLHNHTNKPIQFNAGQSATSFRIFSLSPDTWYSVSVQCTDTTYHISIKSEEIFVHTYSETVERDSLNHLTNLILHVPPEQQTTHIKQDSMIILYLPLSRLNYFISTVYVVSLVIKPTRESHDDEIICSEGCTRKMHYNDITDIYLVESTYKNRHNKENGSWEILIHSRLILSQARARRSMDYKMNGSYLYSDKYFIIGENGVCLYNSHECNGPLKPATQYSIQLRTYTEFGYTTSKIIHGHTLTDNDQTRVKLKPLQKTKQDHDYVNASFIYEIIPCASVYTHPVLNRNKIAYIASQAPLESTVGDFWRMVLDQNITIIVMLTKLYEDNISKCCQYWPNDIHESLTFQSDYLKLEVTLLSEEDHHIYILRKLYITSVCVHLILLFYILAFYIYLSLN